MRHTLLKMRCVTLKKKEVLLECPLSDSTFGCSDSTSKMLHSSYTSFLSMFSTRGFRIALHCGVLQRPNIIDTS